MFLALYLVGYTVKNLNRSAIGKLFEDYISYLIIGIIIGGRIGYVIFYDFNYFIQNPIEIFMIWNGGMSFHGGLCALLFEAVYFQQRMEKIFVFLDLVTTSPV